MLARHLFEVTKAVRAAVSPQFGVGVKINTTDFQRGGFEPKDLYWLAQELNDYRLDLTELSGGSYESPVMATGHSESRGRQRTGEQKSSSARTLAREVYFLEAAKQIQEISHIPIMVTGGISHLSVLLGVISSSDRFVGGVRTALGLMHDLPKRWAKGDDPAPKLAHSCALPLTLAAAAKTTSVQYILHQIGSAQRPYAGVWPTYSLLVMALRESSQMKEYKQWLA